MDSFSSSASRILRDGTPVTGSDPAFTSTATPGVVAAETYEAAVPTGLILTAFLLVVAGTVVGYFSAKATEAAAHAPTSRRPTTSKGTSTSTTTTTTTPGTSTRSSSNLPPYSADPELGTSATATVVATETAPDRGTIKPATRPTSNSTPFRRLVAVAVLLDLYAYFSLIEFIAGGSWNRKFGYSPVFFIVACLSILTQRKPYKSIPALKRILPFRPAFNLVLAVVALSLLIYKMKLENSIGPTGVRTALRLNTTVEYQEVSNPNLVRGGVIYSIIRDGKTSLYQSSLRSCDSFLNAAVTADPANATATTTATTTTLVCQLDQTSFTSFQDVWTIFLLIVTAMTAFYMIADADPWVIVARNVPLALLLFVETCAVFGRSAAAPTVGLELLWCPTAGFSWCQIMDFGAVRPFTLRQTALWFSNLGLYPVDKLAGYGALSQ